MYLNLDQTSDYNGFVLREADFGPLIAENSGLSLPIMRSRVSDGRENIFAFKSQGKSHEFPNT